MIKSAAEEERAEEDQAETNSVNNKANAHSVLKISSNSPSRNAAASLARKALSRHALNNNALHSNDNKANKVVIKIALKVRATNLKEINQEIILGITATAAQEGIIQINHHKKGEDKEHDALLSALRNIIDNAVVLR